MYKIQVLSNKDFDNLPISETRGSDISMSLGFANKFTGNAYVRYTSHPDLQKYLIDHEFEELVMSESAHEDENGIRHKGFWKIFLPIITGGASLLFTQRREAQKRKEANAQRDQKLAQTKAQSAAQEQAKMFGQTKGIPMKGSPMNAFTPEGTTGTSQVPGAFAGGEESGEFGKGINQGGGNQIDSGLADRLKGFYQGRIGF